MEKEHNINERTRSAYEHANSDLIQNESRKYDTVRINEMQIYQNISYHAHLVRYYSNYHLFCHLAML